MHDGSADDNEIIEAIWGNDDNLRKKKKKTFNIKKENYVSFHEDIQPRICELMGFADEGNNFMMYHTILDPDAENINPRKYFNLWHVWLWYVDSKLYNDSFMPHYLWNDDEFSDYFKESFLKEFKDKGWTWEIAEPFWEAVRQVEKELQRDSKSDSILIEYSW